MKSQKKLKPKELNDFSKAVLVEFIRENISFRQDWLGRVERIERSQRFDRLMAQEKELQRQIRCFAGQPDMWQHRSNLLDKSFALGKKMDAVLDEMLAASGEGR